MRRKAHRLRASSPSSLTTGGKVVLVAGVVLVGGLLAVAIVGGLAASSAVKKSAIATSTSVSATGGRAPTSSTTSTTSKAEALAQLLSRVTVSPRNGATRQSLKTVVKVRAVGARLERVRVVAPSAGYELVGALDPAGDEWRSTGALLPGADYTVTYEVAASDGLVAAGSGTFSTAGPSRVVTASVFPSAGIEVGVGQPVVFMFSQPVDTYAAQQAVLSHLRVAMSDPVPGGWHWFSPVELHFRPTNYWPVGEQVQVTADLDGWDVGGGAWGEGQLSTAFVVGDKHISVVNLATHEMTITDNGKLVYIWPVSAGAPRWPTMDGAHIVLDRDSVVHMVSSTVGIPIHSAGGYDEYVYWDVHISDSGEYVHAAPWSVSEQGIQNVSHGCVNLSVARAETFFRFSRVGDIVQILGGPRPPSQGDHGVMDWSFSSSVVIWTPAKVTLLTAPVVTIPTTTVPPPPGAPVFATTLPPNGAVVATTAKPTTTTTTTTVPPTTTTTRPTTTTARPTTTAPPPATTVPATTVPATTLPTTTTTQPTTTTTSPPATTVPATTVPATTVPATTVPVTTVPATTVPATTVPATTVPATTVPATTTSRATTTTARAATTTVPPTTTTVPPTTTTVPTTTTTVATTTSTASTTTTAGPTTTATATGTATSTTTASTVPTTLPTSTTTTFT